MSVKQHLTDVLDNTGTDRKVINDFALQFGSMICVMSPSTEVDCRGVPRFGGWQRRWVPSNPQFQASQASGTLCSLAMEAFLAIGRPTQQFQSCLAPIALTLIAAGQGVVHFCNWPCAFMSEQGCAGPLNMSSRLTACQLPVSPSHCLHQVSCTFKHVIACAKTILLQSVSHHISQVREPSCILQAWGMLCCNCTSLLLSLQDCRREAGSRRKPT